LINMEGFSELELFDEIGGVMGVFGPSSDIFGSLGSSKNLTRELSPPAPQIFGKSKI